MAQQNQIVRLIEVGVSQVNTSYRDFGLAIAALAQEFARNRVGAAAPVALTDSTTGTAAATLAAVVTPVAGIKDGAATFALKAAFDTEIGLIEDANRNLLAKTNELIVLITSTGGRKVQDLPLGAAVANILAAITPATVGGVTSVVDATTGIAQIVTARNNQAAIAAGINYCNIAMGLPPVSDFSGGVFTVTTQYPTVSAAATAAAVTANGASTLTLASVNAALTALTNNISTMAVGLNVMRGAMAIGPFVVATSNPHTRFLGADVTP